MKKKKKILEIVFVIGVYNNSDLNGNNKVSDFNAAEEGILSEFVKITSKRQKLNKTIEMWRPTNATSKKCTEFELKYYTRKVVSGQKQREISRKI